MENSSTLYKLVEEGRQAQQRGDRALALASFTLATQLNPNDENLWWARSELTTDPAEAVRCLEQVLRINPNHPQAQDKLLVSRLGSLQQEARVRTETDVKSRKSGLARIRDLGRFRWRVWLVASALFVLVACGAALVVTGTISGWNSEPRGENIATVLETPTLVVLVMPPTWTPVPSRTPTQTPLPTPTPGWKALQNLMIRSGPGTSYRSIATWPQGTTLVVTGKSEDGKYLQIDVGAGKAGWAATEFVSIDRAAVARLPILAAAPVVPAATRVVSQPRPTLTPMPRPTATPIPQLDFALGRAPEQVGDCSRPWKVLGTVYDSQSTGRRLNGVLVRIWAGDQVVGTVSSGSQNWNMPGYWEWTLGRNSDVVGQVAAVHPDGTLRSNPASFHLTAYCQGTGAANQIILDLVGTR